MTAIAARNEIYRYFQGHPSWQFATRGSRGAPDWLGLLITRIVVLLQDEEVEMFSGHLDFDRAYGKHEGWVAIYTTTRLIRASIAVPSALSEQLSVSASSRSTLQAVEVIEGGTSAFASGDSEWPGRVQVRATYPDGAVDLPGDPWTLEDEDAAKFSAFLSSLLGDLAANRRR